MRHTLPPIITMAVVWFISVALIRGDAASDDTSQPSFRIVLASPAETAGEKKPIRSQAIKARIATLQNELADDPVLTRKLRARGMKMRNVVGREKTSNDVTIIYVR